MSADANTQSQGAVSMGGAQPTEAGQPGAGPAPSVSHGEQTRTHPAGSSRPDGGVPIQERPEAQVGAAFAGGLVLALILKRLGS